MHDPLDAAADTVPSIGRRQLVLVDGRTFAISDEAGQMTAATHGLYSVLHWEVDRSPAPRVHIRPGGYTNDPERAALLGGTLAAGPSPGGGFIVRADLPLDGVVGAVW